MGPFKQTRHFVSLLLSRRWRYGTRLPDDSVFEHKGPSKWTRDSHGGIIERHSEGTRASQNKGPASPAMKLFVTTTLLLLLSAAQAQAQESGDGGLIEINDLIDEVPFGHPATQPTQPPAKVTEACCRRGPNDTRCC
ncbi:hypothetical protein [Cyprinid herpesvirus 2]|nr:hypothetical protein [Cyprinid herpesvirus 2]